TLPGQRLGGLHVDRVDIWAFFAVDLDRNEVLVEHGSRSLILEGLMCHHVAPVARCISDGEEDRYPSFGSRVKSAVRPGPPVHWVFGVLQQVWACRRGEAVAACHPPTLCV